MLTPLHSISFCLKDIPNCMAMLAMCVLFSYCFMSTRYMYMYVFYTLL